MQFFIHYFLHLIAPFFIAALFFKGQVKKSYIIMLLTMLIDADHLLATPIFSSARCSIGFHPLHSVPFLYLYPILIAVKPLRLIGVGLTLHIITDSIDCYLSGYNTAYLMNALQFN